MTSLQIEPEAMQEIVRGAIIQSLTDDAKERLIESAVKYLVTPSSDPYNRRKPPIEEAFEGAIYKAAREVIFETFENDPKVKKAVDDVVHPMVTKLCEGNYDGLPEAVGAAFADWLKSQKTSEY